MRVFRTNQDVWDHVMTLSAEEARAFIKRRTDAPKTVHLKVPEGSIDSSNTDGALETLANARRAGG